MSRAEGPDLLSRCLAGEFPEEGSLVFERVLRRVFRLELAGPRICYVKQHLFPFLRVRLRYALRASPTRREARNFESARALGVRVPVVAGERSTRGWLGPRLAVLVTEALPDGRAPTPAEWCAAARFLASRGVFHPDLHGDNLRMLGEEGPAFLDFQSVRILKGPLPRRLENRMLAKCVLAMRIELSLEACRSLLKEQGFDSEAILAQCEQLMHRELAARRRHVLRASSRVRVRRVGLLGRRLERRDAPELPTEFEAPEAVTLPSGLSLPVAEDKSGKVLRIGPLPGGLRVRWIAARMQESVPPAILRQSPWPVLEREAAAGILAWEREGPWPRAGEYLYIARRLGGTQRDTLLSVFPGGGSDRPESIL